MTTNLKATEQAKNDKSKPLEENDNFELYWVYCWAQWVQKLKNKQYVYCETEQADV